MHVVSSNQIADVLHINDNISYENILAMLYVFNNVLLL